MLDRLESYYRAILDQRRADAGRLALAPLRADQNL
jgi:hypothetical protein